LQPSPRSIQRVLVAPDSLKGTCSAAVAAIAIEQGVLDRLSDVSVDRCPIADGGEGTLDAMVTGLALQVQVRRVSGPRLDRPFVDARFGIASDRRLAVVELAEASGLQLIEPADRDPGKTGTGGTGAMLRASLDLLEASEDHRSQVILAVGGSGTVDGGIGALSMLGVRFRAEGALLAPPLLGADLLRVDAIELPPAIRDAWRRVDLRIAVDVGNPLLGATGAARVFGPQKGADRAGVERLESGMSRWVGLLGREFGEDQVQRAAEADGAGAAGGVGFGLRVVLGAVLESGFDIVATALDLDARVAASDLVITSEGSLDAQSMMGKGPGCLLELGEKHRVPVMIVPGRIGDLADQDQRRFAGIVSLESVCGLQEATSRPSYALRAATEQLLVPLVDGR
jgi:glycerate 2-kinase